MIPEMKKKGYSAPFSAAVIGSAATVAPILPPSVPLILYGSIAEVSIGRLFLGGVFPGFTMGFGMMVLTYFIAKKRNYERSQRASLREIGKAFADSILALLAPLAIVGGIVTGHVTATESAIVAVWISIILGVFVYKELTFKKIIDCMRSSLATSGALCFIIAASAPFGWIMAREGIPTLLVSGLEPIMHIPWLVLLMMLLGIMLIGTVLDGTPVIILLTPILLPVIRQLGIDPVHFGVLLAITTMIGTITPPVGTLMFVTSRIAGCNILEFTKEAWRYFLFLILLLFVFAFIPAITTWLPYTMMP